MDKFTYLPLPPYTGVCPEPSAPDYVNFCFILTLAAPVSPTKLTSPKKVKIDFFRLTDRHRGTARWKIVDWRIHGRTDPACRAPGIWSRQIPGTSLALARRRSILSPWPGPQRARPRSGTSDWATVSGLRSGPPPWGPDLRQDCSSVWGPRSGL